MFVYPGSVYSLIEAEVCSTWSKLKPEINTK